MEAIENGRQNMLFPIQVPKCKNSLNFFVKEYNQGYVYTGSQAEHNIYIIKPDESFSAFDIGMNCLCATMPDEQLLGNLAVVDCSKKQIVSSIKIPDAQSNHVNDITKTDDKTLFVVATNRGLALVKINDSNHKLLVQS